MSFVIVNRHDVPIYEAELGAGGKKEDTGHLHQFVMHAALDVVEEAIWGTQSMYLKVVDRFNDLHVSAWVTAGHAKFLLLHDGGTEDGIKTFFQGVHELYLKVILNPFQEEKTPIASPHFDQRVRSLAKRCL